MTCLRDSFNLKVTSLSQKSKNEDKTNSRVSDPHTPSHVMAVCPGTWSGQVLVGIRSGGKVRLIGGGDGCWVISL